MADQKNAGTAPWHRASVRIRVMLAIACLWPTFPIALFLRRIHVSVVIICFLRALLVLLALGMVVRPDWVERMIRAWQRESERVGEGFEKRPPTGFP